MPTTPLTAQWHHNNCPSMYGNQQDDYNASVRDIVAHGAERIRMAEALGKVDGLFKKIVDWMGEERAAIAQRHDSPDKEHFGVRRKHPEIICCTPFYAHPTYAIYGARAIAAVAPYFRKGTCDKQGKGRVNGKQERVTSKVYDAKTLPETVDLFPEGKVPRPCEMSDLKKQYPEKYKAVKLSEIVMTMRDHRPEKDNDGNVIDPHRCSHTAQFVKWREIEGAWVAIGGIVTRFLVEEGVSLLERLNAVIDKVSVHTFTATMPDGTKETLTQRCVIPSTAVHTDILLLPELEKEIARLFAKAVSWKSHEGEQALKDAVAELRYLFANAMPFERGSGAIGEWLELSIYHAHGFVKARHKEETNGDMSALSSLTLSQFLLDYPLLIELGERVVEGDAFLPECSADLSRLPHATLQRV